MEKMTSSIIVAIQNNSVIELKTRAIIQQVAEYFNANIYAFNAFYDTRELAEKFSKDEFKITWETVTGATVLTKSEIIDGYRLEVARILPTARNPLSGFDTLTQAQEKGVILASPKQDFIYLPCYDGKPRQTLSTGFLTEPNYTISKAGALGELAHKIGFIIIFNGQAYQVEIKNGCAIFNGLKFDGQDVTEAKASGIVFSDVHCQYQTDSDIEAIKASLDVLMPSINEDTGLVFHDVVNFGNNSHHARGCNLHKMSIVDDSNIPHELLIDMNTFMSIFDEALEKSDNYYFVESNHHEHLKRWLSETNISQTSAINARFLVDMLQALKDDKGHYMQIALELAGYDDLMPYFLEHNSSLVIEGVHCQNHGHYGANGARATDGERLGLAMVTGHTHTPRKKGDHFTVGVCGKDYQFGYNKGASSWLMCHAIIWDNGTIQASY